MTRRHYIEAARRLSEIPDLDERRKLGAFLADFFSADNHRFDRARFLAAAGL